MLVSGKVVHGSGIGKQLRFPTANLDLKKEDVELSAGVYSALVFLFDKEYLASLTILESPVFKFEVHLLDYIGEDFYSEILKVQIGEKISDIIKFDNTEALKKKIEEDLLKIKSLKKNT